MAFETHVVRPHLLRPPICSPSLLTLFQPYSLCPQFCLWIVFYSSRDFTLALPCVWHLYMADNFEISVSLKKPSPAAYLKNPVSQHLIQSQSLSFSSSPSPLSEITGLLLSCLSLLLQRKLRESGGFSLRCSS